MPEMQMRYQPVGNGGRALKMVGKAKEKAAELFGKEVVTETREFGLTDGQPNFLINIWVTDNKDELVEVALEVQSAVLELMADESYEGETVECWVQRVKGKWGQAAGRQPRP